MYHDLFPLVVIGGLLFVAAALLCVLVPSQRPAIPCRAMQAVARKERFWRRVAFFILCSIVCASVPYWPQHSSDRAFALRVLHGTLFDALAAPFESLLGCSLPLAIGCVLLMPLCDDRWIGPRSEIPAWSPTGRVFTYGRHKWTTRIVTGLGIAVVAVILLFQSLQDGMLFALFFYLAWLGWSGRRWLEADDVGVNWTGYRFRWDEVTSWRIEFTAGSNCDDGSNDQYRLFVVLTNGYALNREDISPHQLENLFFRARRS